MSKVSAVDLFRGAGGTSTGLAQACRDLSIPVDLLAISVHPRSNEILGIKNRHGSILSQLACP